MLGRGSMNSRIEDVKTRLAVTEKGARRVLEIVSAGVEVLLEEGFTALTKRRIATRLGISHGNVSYYFPTRESLWQAVIDVEVRRHYRDHYDDLKASANDPEKYFDEYITRWIGEYEDRELRIFFSQFLAFAEVNPMVAELRDEIYERFLNDSLEIVMPLIPGVSRPEAEQRVLKAMALLEGLQPVTAFRPDLLGESGGFRQSLRHTIVAIIRGQRPE